MLFGKERIGAEALLYALKGWGMDDSELIESAEELIGAPEVEFCDNDEWLMQRIDGGTEGLACDDSTITGELVTTALRVAEADSRLVGINFTRAKGPRALYHGWNGAGGGGMNMRGIFGTFTDLPAEQIEALEEAQAAGEKAAKEMLAKFESQIQQIAE
jgi:hypothetical protein